MTSRRPLPSRHARLGRMIGAGAVFVGQMFGLAFGVFGIWATVEIAGMMVRP